MRLRNCFGMIWSVSTSTRSITASRPVWRINGSIFLPLVVPLADVDEVAGDRRRRGHGRADEVRAAALALAALEVAVRGGGAALPRLQHVRVHAQAHRAARLAPV